MVIFYCKCLKLLFFVANIGETKRFILFRATQVGFAEFNNTADNRANIGGTIIGAPIVGQ